MALSPKARSGPSASVSVTTPALRGLPRSTRQRRPTESEFERVRLREIEHRVELYTLKVERLRAGLLDRREVESAYAAMVGGIRQIIAQSRLSQSEREDIYGNLVTAGEFVATIAARQTADSGRGDQSTVANANGGIDQEP